MKVLIATPYIYKQEWPEFTKNQTGFGIMVNLIFESVSDDADVYLISHVITKGHEKVIKHTWGNVFGGARLKDWKNGFKYFFKYTQGIKGRLRYFYYALNAGCFRKTINEIKPDIVHIHGIGVQTKHYIDCCEEARVPYVVTLHGLIGLDESIKAPSWDKQIEKDFLISSDKQGVPVTVISTGMKRRIEENYLHHEANNITVVCNGTRIPYTEELVNLPVLDIRDKFQLVDEKIIVVNGTLCNRKNQIQIVRALKKVKTPFHMFLCGADDSQGLVQTEINKVGLNNSIHILGFLPKDLFNQVLDQSDLNIVASIDEGYGLSIIEAYKHGIPTVSFADIDAVRYLYDDRAMIKVDERTDDALAKGIERGLNLQWNKDWIKDISDSYSLEKYVELFKNEYNETLINGGYISIAKICDFLAIKRRQGYKIISYVGNISDNKNQIELVNQMPNLVDLKVIAVLAGKEADGGKVRNLVIDNYDENVILTGFCSEMDSIWVNVDINIFLSKNDGFGLSVIEGYMRGVPSIMRKSLDAYYDVNGVGTYGLDDNDDLKSIIKGIDKEIAFKNIINFSKRFSLDFMKESYIETYKMWC